MFECPDCDTIACICPEELDHLKPWPKNLFMTQESSTDDIRVEYNEKSLGTMKMDQLRNFIIKIKKENQWL